MIVVPRLSSRRVRPALAVAALLGATVAITPAHASSPDYTTNCPAPESLVPQTAWHRHYLAKGVVLSEGSAKDRRGTVQMHVLTVDMTNTALRFGPLMRHVSQRSPLSSLASGHAQLVAATNTGYYDFYLGTPLGSVVSNGAPVTEAAAKHMAVGIGTDHRVHTGHVWLSGSVTVAGVSKPLAGFNLRSVPTGLSVYTSTWGSPSIPVPYGAVSRYINNGVLTSSTGRYMSPPPWGTWMLVARGTTSVDWLKSLRKGATVTRRATSRADTTVALATAFGVGENIVAKPGVVRYGLPCRSRYPQPARNAVGWANSGKKLIIAVVTDRPGTSVHGLDASQTSKLMVELGASQAYLWDGSGSAEMIGRMPSTGRLSIRNYPADGQERTMPVGFGVYRS